MAAKIVVPTIALVLLAGCSEQSHGPHVRSGDPDVEVQSPTALSNDQLRQLAQQISAAAQNKDPAALAAVFDWDGLLYTAASDLQAPKAEHIRFAAEMKGNDKKLGVLGQKIVEWVKEGAQYKFLRAHVEDGQQRLLFRLAVPDAVDFNYHDVVLSRRPDGKVRASDVYIFNTGEMLSQTTRRAFIMSTLRLAEASTAKLKGIEPEFQQHFKKIELMNDFIRVGQYKDVLRLYDQLPLRLQRDKNVMLTRLVAAQAVGGDANKAAIDDFRNFFPDDPCIERFAIVYCVEKRDFPAALSKVDVIEKAIGGDPYLDVIRATLQLEADNPAAARKLAEKAVAAEPTLRDAYMTLVFVSLKEGNHAETLDRLKDAYRRFAPALGDLTKQPKFAEFVKSPQYQEWLKWRSTP